jgi:hypothetical protein
VCIIYLGQIRRLLHEKRNTILEFDTDYTHITQHPSKISQIRPEHKDDDDDDDDDDDECRQENSYVGGLVRMCLKQNRSCLSYSLCVSITNQPFPRH